MTKYITFSATFFLAFTLTIDTSHSRTPQNSRSVSWPVAPVHVVHPDVYDPQPIPAVHCSDKPAAFLRFHIREDFFSNLQPATICKLKSGGAPCISESKANHGGDDDDGSETYIQPGTGSTITSDNWPTPLDIDLSGYWKAIADKTKTIQIKIILDDPNMKFNRRQTSSATDPTDALTQGKEGSSMFVCRSDIQTDPPSGKLSIAVRAKYIQGYGGLNIGILYTIGGLVLPLFIDPRVHSDG